MWFFVVTFMLANGDIINNRSIDYPTFESCAIIQQLERHQLQELGTGFFITECKQQEAK